MSMHVKERVPNRWLIATMCTVLQLCLGTVYALSYFQPLLVEQFRWTNTETSWAFSLTICWRVWHPDDGARSVGLRHSGMLCAELFRRRLRNHAVHGN